MAKAAARSANPALREDLPLRDVNALVRRHCRRIWDDEYQRDDRGSHYKLFQGSVVDSVPLPENRLYQRILFRLQSGHCRLNSHLHRIKCAVSPDCELCHCPETVRHFLIDCPKYQFYRRFLAKACRNSGTPFTMKNLLTLRNLTTHVGEFVQSCDRFL